MLKTNEIIYKILTSSTELNTIVNQNIYAIDAPIDTPLPLVVYSRSIDLAHNKDYYTAEIDYEIGCYSDNYTESLDIAQIIFDLINNYEENNVKKILIYSINEEISDTGSIFLQKLNCKMKFN
jgi:hypothetical protein